ncbi:MAG: hypothetical protein RBT03_00285 [Kiritimatiellia bacterium]|jgi:hypothetical protein|nr:hypothetical protein [Kiritimatiellia bacterium]
MKPEKFKTGRPGFGCKDGKLYRFEKKSVLVLAPWPEPQAWFKSNRRGWHSSRKRADKVFSGTLFSKDWLNREGYGFIGEFCWELWEGDPGNPQPGEVEQYMRCHGKRHQSPEDIIEHRRKIREGNEWCENNKRAVRYVRQLLSPYFDAIPDEVREDLFRYKNRRWHLFCLFARCPGALDLSRSNPALCYALASHWVFHKPATKWPMRSARSLIVQKQKKILGWLGFPGTETARRIMAKIDPLALNIKRLWAFRRALEDIELSKWLSHLERINEEVMDMVAWRDHRPYLSAKLVKEVSRENDWVKLSDAKRLFDDTMRMAREMPVVQNHRPIQSLRQLKTFHDLLTQEQHLRWLHGRLAQQRDLHVIFPNPPFAGTPTILPVRDLDGLLAEGFKMRHCVAIYEGSIAAGSCYIYRVIKPVRATLQIVLNRERRCWERGELMASGNRPVPEPLASLLFNEVFSSGKYGAEEEVKLMDEDWTPEEVEKDPQLVLFDQIRM